MIYRNKTKASQSRNVNKNKKQMITVTIPINIFLMNSTLFFENVSKKHHLLETIFEIK
jgi:hypothetical protein